MLVISSSCCLLWGHLYSRHSRNCTSSFCLSICLANLDRETYLTFLIFLILTLLVFSFEENVDLTSYVVIICTARIQFIHGEQKVPYTHTQPFNGPLYGTTRVNRYQKDKTWAICKSAPRSRQIIMPAPHHSVFTGCMPFLSPNQQHQSTEGKQKAP